MINKTAHFIISLFAMLITLLSFVLLSIQILFISLIWMFIRFLQLLNNKLNHYLHRYSVEPK